MIIDNKISKNNKIKNFLKRYKVELVTAASLALIVAVSIVRLKSNSDASEEEFINYSDSHTPKNIEKKISVPIENQNIHTADKNNMESDEQFEECEYKEYPRSGYIKTLPNGHHASEPKKKQADEQGIILKENETVVNPTTVTIKTKVAA